MCSASGLPYSFLFHFCQAACFRMYNSYGVITSSLMYDLPSWTVCFMSRIMHDSRCDWWEEVVVVSQWEAKSSTNSSSLHSTDSNLRLNFH